MGAGEKALQAVIKMRDETSKILRQVETATKSLDTQTNSASESQIRLQNTMDKVGTVAKRAGVGIIAGIGAGLAGATKVGMDFEKSMSQVAATMGMTASEVQNGSKEYEMLSDAAEKAGASTKYSASQAGEALNFLALAGYDAKKATEALPDVLDLAAAGGMDLGYASDLVTDSMSALGIEMSQLTNFTDQMAKASQKSNTNISQLGEAILTVGGTAKVLAGGTVELNTMLGILADNGVKGAEGGTALRNVILALTAPTDKAAGAIKKLGVEVLDAQGNVRPLNDVFKDLDKALGGMANGEKTKVLNEIFNKVDLKSVNALLANSGERFDELSGYIKDCDGTTKEMADTMQNNLAGQLTSLKSVFEALGVAIYKKMQEPLKDAVAFAVDAVKSVTEEVKGEDLGKAIKSIASSIGTLITAITKAAKVALPPLLKGLGWILKNGKGIAAVLLSIKGAMMWASAVKTVKDLAIAFKTAKTAVMMYKVGMMTAGTQLTAFQLIVGVFTGKMAFAEAVTIAFKGALTALGGTTGIIILAVMAVVAGIIYLWNTNKGFRDNVIAAWNLIRITANKVWGSICLFFTQTIPQAWENTKQAFIDAPQWFAQVWDNIKQSFSDRINAIKQVLTIWKNFMVFKIHETVEGMKSKFEAGINSIKNFFTQTIPNIVQSVVDWFKELPERLGEIIGFAIGRTIIFGIAIKNFFTQTIPEVVNNIVNWFKELPSKIAEQFDMIVTNVTTWGVNFYTNATTTVSNTVNSIVNFFVTLPDRIATFFNMVIQNVITWGTQFVTNARTGVTNAVNIIVTFMSQLPGKVKAKFNQVVAAAVAWATSFASKGKEGATKFATRLYDELKKIPGKVKKFGKDIVDGILNGIQNAINGAANAFASFGRGIVNGIKKGLDINSPSGLARDEIGVHIPTGIAVGVAKAIPTAVRMINKSMAKMVDDIDTPETEMSIGVSTSNSSNTGVSSSQTSTQQGNGTVSVTRGKGDINFQFNVENLTVREESDIKKIAKELVKELKLAGTGGVVSGDMA
ncbi:phage tail tape measure protein [Metaclostridioides mangenotii]|uniref:phage tail tape measure protein n=1 Tax=Metaclostridioides mangenotii TaxID=1540 RepID=UPI00068E05A6|nr:phage tail tape measure protein [Clostridioides mangenotii]